MSELRRYIPTPTALKMHNSALLVRAVMGPPGSGKSVANVMELLFLAMRQRPTPAGIRSTRWLVVRKTYASLGTTTLKTLREWLPSQYGSIRDTAPMQGKYVIPLPDGTTVHMELILLSLEKPADMEKLNSLEITGAWINEADEVDVAIIAKCVERSGRFPSRMHWPSLPDEESHITWRGVLLDYNPPPKGHPLVKYLDSEETPDNAILFKQPAALIEHQDPETGKYTYELNPDAENVRAGADGGNKYFDDLKTYQAQGNYDLIETRLLCRYGGVRAGKPVWNNFDYREHVAEAPLEPRAGTDVVIAMDTSGIHPCAIMCQHVRNRWEVQDGIYGDEMGLEEFMDALLTPLLQTKYADCRVLFVCDPANARDGMTATSPTTMIKERGYRAVVAPTNAFAPRREAVDSLFFRRNGVIIDPRLEELVEACSGEYKYRKLRAVTAAGTSQYAAEPEKSKWSHWADALQYFALHVGRNKTDDHEALGRGAVIARSVARKRRVV